MGAGKKYDNVFVGYSFWLSDKEHGTIISPEMWQLLIRIDQTGSISSAAREMQISYRKAWNMIRECEAALGFQLFIKSRGGKSGGLTILSEEGKTVILAYNNMVVSIEDVFKKYIIDFKRTLKQKNP